MDTEYEGTMTEIEGDDVDPAWDDEAERIFRWRLESLTESGYEYGTAFKLALRPSVDLHEAARLVARGCPAHTAARILL